MMLSKLGGWEREGDEPRAQHFSFAGSVISGDLYTAGCLKLAMFYLILKIC